MKVSSRKCTARGQSGRVMVVAGAKPHREGILNFAEGGIFFKMNMNNNENQNQIVKRRKYHLLLKE